MRIIQTRSVLIGALSLLVLAITIFAYTKFNDVGMRHKVESHEADEIVNGDGNEKSSDLIMTGNEQYETNSIGTRKLITTSTEPIEAQSARRISK